MKALFIFCSILFIFLAHFINANDGCMTPNNRTGVCISFRNCAPLYQMLANIRVTPLSDENKKLIQQSRCIPEQGTNMVNPICCPSPTTLREVKKANQIPERYVLPTPGECGIETKERIIGGTVTSITDFPWMALINYSKTRRRGRKGKKEKQFKCGGSLISKNYVLTAAHCVTGRVTRDGWQPTSVRLGENNLRTSPDYDSQDEPRTKTNAADPEVDVEISEVIKHENYTTALDTPYNDIALIRLSRSIVFTDFIKPICLPVAPHLKETIYDNVAVVVAGFGVIETGRPSDVKLKLEMFGFNWVQCKNIYQRKHTVPVGPNEICAGGEQYEDTCSGDSGGPLVASDRISMPQFPYSYLVGVVSRGPQNCGTKGVPGIYTRVDKYLDWIMNNLRK